MVQRILCASKKSFNNHLVVYRMNKSPKFGCEGVLPNVVWKLVFLWDANRDLNMEVQSDKKSNTHTNKYKKVNKRSISVCIQGLATEWEVLLSSLLLAINKNLFNVLHHASLRVLGSRANILVVFYALVLRFFKQHSLSPPNFLGSI